MRAAVISGINPGFPGLSQSQDLSVAMAMEEPSMQEVELLSPHLQAESQLFGTVDTPLYTVDSLGNVWACGPYEIWLPDGTCVALRPEDFN